MHGEFKSVKEGYVVSFVDETQATNSTSADSFNYEHWQQFSPQNGPGEADVTML